MDFSVKAVNNPTFKTPLAKLQRKRLNEIESANAIEFVNQYHLEVAKSFWEQKPKKAWQFWKKNESEAEYIHRKTVESIKSKKNNS